MRVFSFFILAIILYSCKEADDVDFTKPIVSSYCFPSDLNGDIFNNDIHGNIIGDSIIELWIPSIASNKCFIAQLSFIGDSVLLNSERFISGKTLHNYSKPSDLTVYYKDKKTDYRIYVYSYTGLPSIDIYTENGEIIESKDNYIPATFRITDNYGLVGQKVVLEANGEIKGRGNATWYTYPRYAYPKKPYRIKLENKYSIFNNPKDKSYVLLANVIDKTSLRFQTALYMSDISDLEYTPRFAFVDLFLNKEYVGIYQFGDKLSISKYRVNTGNDGYLLEIDIRAVYENATCFYVKNLTSPLADSKIPINIKEPDMDINDDRVNYVRDFCTLADSVLFSEGFKDPIMGWQKYMDINSFVDWYLINELTRNGDALLYTSCFMSLSQGGKLKMGPIWDFDTAFGNNNTPTTTPAEGFYIKDASWFSRLYEDPVFVTKVKERFGYFYNRRNDIYDYIDAQANYIKYSIDNNQHKWNNLYVQNFSGQQIWGGVL